ncbi:MAG: tRNA threonylcarbamoyladenosine dehydratase [Peptococcaceae bacterium]|nr:tRNA threonylcarbamoyladenosine dehydratase [Peptococcaceae bacterium]
MELARRTRTEKIIGKAGCEKLALSTVAICGLGGVGSYVVEALARAGVGHFILIDFDTVSISNINRQIEATTETVGQAKTIALKQRIAAINPEASVAICSERLTAKNISKLVFAETPDFLVDAIDDVPAKISLLAQAKTGQVPVISVMGTGNKLHPEQLEIADICKTEVCPLARKVRKALKAQGITKGIPVVYSKEIPVHKEKKAGETKEEDRAPGSISFVPGAAGLIAAGFVVRSLLKID